eukprot:TRINITY_DN3137_c0_g1_i1.p1 TRINITY_DN3137_c0_g1~~TRINITY_DN3137_c0_g1_i1.p1  ORF type:complete len:524 (+),score=97.05 TRINITY_DN3137_c0_g1_i1:97-1572(+)
MKVAKLPIPPTENEMKIFKTLIGVNDTFGLKCTLRVAGGWVRDRLLGHQSNDIDIALEGMHEGTPMTGSVYSHFVARYQEEHGLEASHIGTIKANPDQSKHLETATMQICGIDIDFVNLRCEEYATSRIPIVRPGTPGEDAHRRDLTINALFYNIHTDNVEDFTSGLSDLSEKIVRTPLPPLTTFYDDPLRLLRCVRFACRFGCVIDPVILEAAQDADIHRVLRDKVSRSRIGIETSKMLASKSAIRSLELFRSFGIEKIVFEECTLTKKGKLTSTKPVDFSDEQWQHSLDMIRSIDSDSLELNLTCIAAPYLQGEDEMKLDGRLQNILTHGLSISAHIAGVSVIILRAARKLPDNFWDMKFDLKRKYTNETYEEGSDHPARTALCEMMQYAVEKVAKNEVRELWRETLLISCTLNKIDVDRARTLIVDIEADDFFVKIPTMKPVLRGDELTKLLELPVGPAIKTALQAQFMLQCQISNLTSEDVLRFLKR